MQAPGTEFVWFFFENDLAKANRNCRRRHHEPEHRAHVEGLVDINIKASAWYSIPEGAFVLKMFEVPPPAQ